MSDESYKSNLGAFDPEGRYPSAASLLDPEELLKPRAVSTSTLKPPKPPENWPSTWARIKHLASEAMSRPSTLTIEEIKELGASVLRHIEPRLGKIS
jgi:hypothetical protein